MGGSFGKSLVERIQAGFLEEAIIARGLPHSVFLKNQNIITYYSGEYHFVEHSAIIHLPLFRLACEVHSTLTDFPGAKV